MKKSILFTIAFASFAVSCQILGLTNDYKKLSEVEQQKIVALESFENVSLDKIYKINGQQLRTELAKHEKSLVYIFKNGCTSEFCKPMYVYENYAKKNGYKLFLIMDGYGNLNETLEQRNNFSTPLFSIDNEFYDSNIRNNYFRYFENDLQGIAIKIKPKEYLGSLYFFNKDKLEKITRDLSPTKTP
jgi:hypothetical protein